MTDLVVNEVVPAARWTLTRIWQELGNMFCYKSNIGDLKDRVQQLRHKRDGIKVEEKSAREASKIIDGQVTDWLVKADKKIEETETSFSEETVASKAACCNGWLPNLKCHLSLGRKAKKMTLEVGELFATEPKTISHPAPHPVVEFQPTQDSVQLGTNFQEGASSSGTSNHEHSTHPTEHSTHLGTHFHEGASSSGTSNHEHSTHPTEHSTHLGTHFHEGASSSGTSNHGHSTHPTEHSTHLRTHFHEGASSSGTSHHEQPAALLNFDSRRSTFGDVMEALRGNQINPIIICGLGGMGKTTLMGQVHEKAKKEGLFDEYTKASIKESLHNKAPDLNVIQDELARFLGLTLDGKETDARASKLRDRLSQGSKKILVMLDNVWTTTPDFLWDIGIPRGCKLLVTSRHQDLFKDMDTRKNFPIYGLPDKDAWSLFKKTAGSSIESDPELQVVAEKILKECAGLPIAISTVGIALKGESIGIWKNALKELEKANPENVPGVIEHVYGKIKFSYECLPNEQAKSCFLLCCIFKGSAYIRIEDLVRYGLGLELFKGIDSMVEGRNRVETLVRTLKSRFLLLESDKKECVRMHDVVCDVAVHIASEEFTEKKDDAVGKRIVVRDKVETLNMMDCPISEQPAFCRSLFIGGRCVLLWLGLKKTSVLEPQLRMEDLKVLAIMGKSLSLVVPSLAVMKNLQTLRLEEYIWYDEVFDASVIGEMRTLKILSFRGCWRLEQLPDTFKNLSDLRLLDLSRCPMLKVISAGVISSLTRLEELYMLGSGYDWISDKLASTKTTNSISQLQAELESARSEIVMPFEFGKQSPSIYIRWANCMDWESGILAELLSLTRLTTLQVVLPPLNHVLTTTNLFKKLERFLIFFHWRRRDIYLLRYEYAGIDGNYLEVYDIDSSATVGSGITSLLKITSSLEFSTVTETQLVNVVDTICFAKIKHFKLIMYNDVEYLIDTTRMKPTTPHGSSAIFPLLNSLEIVHANRMKEIFHGELPKGSLKELRSLELTYLPAVTYIWKTNSRSEWGVLRNIIGVVQELYISCCESLEEIVAFEYDNEEVINFQSLEQLTLRRLPNFTGMTKNISKETERPPENSSREKSNVIIQPLFDTKVHFPVLTKLEIEDMHLKEIWNDLLSAESFCELKSLKVKDCPKLLHVVPTHMQNRLQKLEYIYASFCDSLEEIFEFRKSECIGALALTISESGNQGTQINKMMSFKQSCQVFQNLGDLEVRYCRNLRTLMSPSVARGLVKLHRLSIHYCNKIEEIVAATAGGEETSDGNMFPQMNTLIIENLRNLQSFSEGKYNFKWPRVENIVITGCPNMKKFCLGSLSLPKVVEIDVRSSGVSLLQELNNSRKEI